MNFYPTLPATREDIAVALVRIMGLTEKDAKDPNYASRAFKDANDISPGLRPYISIAAERGLIKGYEDGTFRPTRNVTRAESVVLLLRATKQAVSTVNDELDVTATVIVGSNPAEITLKIEAEEGTRVTVNGEPVRMDNIGNGYVAGMYLYTFEEEGTKTFIIEAFKGSKRARLERTAKYEIGAPRLTITEVPETTDKNRVTIRGRVEDPLDPSPLVTINGRSVYVDYAGWFSETVGLDEGANRFTIEATNKLGKTTTVERTIVITVDAPVLTITEAPDTTDKSSATIRGTVQDKNDSSPIVTINGRSVHVDYIGRFSETVNLVEGENRFTITATNKLGKTTTVERTIVFTAAAPEIIFTNVPEATSQKNITLSGYVRDASGEVKLYINDQEVFVYPTGGSFSKNVTLSEGDNLFVFRAVNKYGKSTTIAKTVRFGEIGQPTLTVDDVPAEVSTDVLTISGRVSDSLDPDVSVFVNDRKVASSAGSWTATVTLKEGSNDIIIVATNKFGKSTTIVKKVICRPPAADTGE